MLNIYEKLDTVKLYLTPKIYSSNCQQRVASFKFPYVKKIFQFWLMSCLSTEINARPACHWTNQTNKQIVSIKKKLKILWYNQLVLPD